MTDKPRVVILGGGFAGLGAAGKLKKAKAEVVLIDKHDYHTFQPMLYQVATNLIATEEVAHPLRDLARKLPNLLIHRATVTNIDLAKRELEFQEMAPLAYDYLVIALGAKVNFFGVKGAAEYAFPLYTLPDAVRLKYHILNKWDAADKDRSLIEDGALNIVVVGGGPTGVESAGALIELYRGNFIHDYRDMPAKDAKVTLVEFAPNIFSMFKEDIQKFGKRALEKRGVEVRLGEAVTEVTPTRVHLKSGEVLKAHTLVWGAGLQANPITKTLGIELQKGGRIPVGPDLSIAGHPEVFAVGDVAWMTDTNTDQVLPQLGGPALQAGELAGENIARDLKRKEREPFIYFDKGTMATIGRGAAVTQLPNGMTMKGKLAQFSWGFVHLWLLSGGDARTKTVIDWSWAGVSRKRIARVTIDPTEK
ncbi:MAG: NAD(P)/FAD-dependent oxidoreductase [Chloroflexota bacterium]|nr:MAG: NAD(P)/FAD-dependent oxidoreductase [Chloroflexota bacterium]